MPFFSFFFFLFHGVGGGWLARDGCLVRSWLGVAQRGGAAGRRAKRGGVELCNKHNPHPHAIARFGGGFFLSLRNDHFT